MKVQGMKDGLSCSQTVEKDLRCEEGSLQEKSNMMSHQKPQGQGHIMMQGEHQLLKVK